MLVRTSVVAGLFNVSEETIRRWEREAKIPRAIRVGPRNERRWELEEMQALAQERNPQEPEHLTPTVAPPAVIAGG